MSLTLLYLIFWAGPLYASHYNTRRPHRALQLRPPRPEALLHGPIHALIRRRPILGGLINEYERAA